MEPFDSDVSTVSLTYTLTHTHTHAHAHTHTHTKKNSMSDSYFQVGDTYRSAVTAMHCELVSPDMFFYKLTNEKMLPLLSSTYSTVHYDFM